MPLFSQSLHNIQSLILNQEKCLNMTSFSVISIEKAISEFQEDFAQLTTHQKSDPCFRLRGLGKRSDALLCWEDSAPLSIHPFEWQGNIVQMLLSVREESEILYRHELGRQFATVQTIRQHRPDAALIRKRIKHVMERQLQFIVWILLDYVWAPPWEHRTNVKIGFLSLINRGL
jgi:hypothetical protein